MTKLDLKNRWQNWRRRWRALRGRDPERAMPTPGRDWRRMLYFWFACAALVLAGATFVARRVDQLADFSTLTSEAGSDEAAPVIKPEALKKAREFIDARAERFQTLDQTAPLLVDPSR